MDISISLKSLRRWIAGIGIATIISSLIVIPTASAANFWDDAYEALSDAGVVTEEKASSPLSRCAFAKMVVSATLGEVEDPEESPYSDVAVTDACAPFIVAGADAGYWEGFPDGTFRPNKTLNRWEMMKILVSALGLDVLEGDDATGALEGFEDGSSAPDWAGGYAAAAVEAELITGKDIGGKKFLAGGEIVNRGQGFVVTNRVMELGEGEEGEPAEGEGEEGEPAEGEGEEGEVVTPPAGPAGGLAAALASDSPAATVLGDGTSGTVLTKITLTATGGNVSITGLKIQRVGFAADSDLSGVYVNDATGLRHGNVVTFSENVAEATFSAAPITVTAGTPTTISLAANIAAAAVSGSAGAKTMGFILKALTSDASATTGTPVSGAVHTIVDGATSVATLTVDSATISTATRNVNVGTNAQEVGRFTFASGSNEPLLLKKITFLNNGNAADGDFKNFVMKSPSGKELCKADQSVAKYITCTISDGTNPYYKLDKGITETFRTIVDVKSGSTRTVQFRIQNDYDIEAVGETTGAGILATAAGSVDSGFPIGDGTGAGGSATYNSLTLGAGTLLVSKDAASPSGNVSQGGKQVTVGSWKLEAQGENMEVQRVCFELDSTGTTFAITDLTGTIRVKKSSGTAVYSIAPVADHIDGTCNQVTLSSYFTIKSGESETLSVVIDYASAAVAARTHTANFGSVYYKRTDTNDFQTAASTAIAANALTIAAASLTPTSNPSMGNQTVVRGSGSDVQIGSVQLQAGPAETVSVQTITMSIDNDGTANLTDNDTLAGISNLKLKKGTTVLGTAIGAPSGDATGNSFTVSGQLDLVASETVTVDVYAQLSTSADATVRPFIPALGITFVGATSNASSTTPTAATALQTITTTASGSITVTKPIQSTQRVLHAGETGVELLAFKLEAASEAIVVDKLLVTAINGGGNVTNLKLTDSAGTAVYQTGVGLVTNVGTFSKTGGLFTVPKDTIVTYKLFGDTTGSGTLSSAQTVELRLASIDARGGNSGVQIVETSSTTEASSTSSTGHYPANTVIFYENAAVTTDITGVVTVLNEESSDLTAGTSRLTLAINDTAAAITTIVAATNITKIPTVSAGTVPASGTGPTVAVGDILWIVDGDGTPGAEMGLAVAKTAPTGGAVENTETFTIIEPGLGAAAGTATDAGATYTAATGDIVIRIKTASNTSVDNADANADFAIAIGDVLFWAPQTDQAADSQFAVATDVVASGGDASAANIVVNGITMAGTGDTMFRYAPICGEAVSTAATCSYNVGDVVVITDASAVANNGLQVVNVALPAGGDLSASGALAASNTNIPQLVAGAANDAIAKLFDTPLASNVHVVHDVEPVIVKSATALSTSSVLQSMQDIAIFDITASGTRNLSVSALSVLCTGAGASNAELNDNAMEIKVDGALQASSAENSTDVCDTGDGRSHTFASPIEITAGGTKSFLLRYDTGATAGQWSTGESILMRITGTGGRSGGGLSWFYTAAAPSPGTEPTSTSPATVSDSYPVDGPSLTF